MVQVQIEVPDHLEKQLRIWMAYNDINNKPDAINLILDEYFILRPSKLINKDNNKVKGE